MKTLIREFKIILFFVLIVSLTATIGVTYMDVCRGFAQFYTLDIDLIYPTIVFTSLLGVGLGGYANSCIKNMREANRDEREREDNR